MGHTLGMSHDFGKNGNSDPVSASGAPCKGDYTTSYLGKDWNVNGRGWSPCGEEALRKLYNRELEEKGKWCMPPRPRNPKEPERKSTEVKDREKTHCRTLFMLKIPIDN